MPGGEALGGGIVGLGTGVFVALGAGDGGSSSTECDGEGKGGIGAFLVFEFSFALSLALGFTTPMSLGLSPGSGEAEVFGLMVELVTGFVLPPAGIPASDSPVGGFAGSTGELFGSAARVVPGVGVFVGCEFRVNA